MRNFLQLMAPVLKAVKERDEDPKNVVKGEYIQDVYEAWCKMGDEIHEVAVEMLDYVKLESKSTEQILRNLRHELADVIFSASMALCAVERELKEYEDEHECFGTSSS